MSSIAVVQAYGQEERELKRFAEYNQKSLESELRAIRLSKTFKRVSQMMIATGTFAVLFYGGIRVTEGFLSVGDLVVFVSYLKSLYGPIDKFTMLIIQQAKALASGERVVELVRNDIILEDAPDAIEAPPFRGKITFRNVSFSYDRKTPVLRNLNIEVQPGQTIALVGHSGAGKSTLMRLLLRFFDPTEGEILIDDIPIKKFKLKSLRRQITIVMQDAVLFRKTIRENIAFGKPDATEEEIIEAAKRAQIHDYIMSLPDGYDTLLDERGENLSGGQKQRISIARAIIRDAPILIFDEPTTGLDARLENEVNRAIENLTRGRTSFIIAHRFSTILRADQILVLEEGQIAERGTHEELIRNNKNYRELFEMQFGHLANQIATT
jgi:ABC-type multidrug transport system fused ATPase/permease subunit